MAKVLIPLANGFEEIEATSLADVLRRAEITVILAGLQPGPVVSERNISIMPDVTLDNISVDDFDMIVLPGGQHGTDNLARDPRITHLLHEFNTAGKLIGAIGAAPIVLANAGVLDGKRVTCHPGYRDKLDNTVYEDAAVVADGNIITSQGPATAITYAVSIISRLIGKQIADATGKELLQPDIRQEREIWDQRLFNNTIQSLVGALEMKDSYTQGHAKRVTEYSLCIGSKLNLSDTELRDLYLGAVLHDIGKIGTEEDLLNKPDGLNLREETLIREHPLKGTLFIVGIENLSHIVPTILHHHERWDGKGYPGRLKGEQIPLHARIVSITDAFDAMVSVRSYRPALDKDAAILELQKQKGTQFDPFIVDVFIECLNDSPYEMKDFSYYF